MILFALAAAVYYCRVNARPLIGRAVYICVRIDRVSLPAGEYYVQLWATPGIWCIERQCQGQGRPFSPPPLSSRLLYEFLLSSPTLL